MEDVTRIFIYLLLFGTALYFLSIWTKRNSSTAGSAASGAGRPSKRFRSKVNPRELWVQVFETASIEEARALQARLQEEEVECIVYEQGKKDIHGNEMAGIGLAVPKTAAPHSQSVISRMLS